MSHFLLRTLSRLLLAVTLLWAAAPSQAQASGAPVPTDLSIIGPGTAAAVIVAAAVVVVGIGVSIYFIARQPRVTGCVATGPDGRLTLQGTNPGDPLYLLEGDTAALQPGSRVKLIGRRKKDANKQQVLTLSRVAKTYGACTAPARALVEAAGETTLASTSPGDLLPAVAP